MKTDEHPAPAGFQALTPSLAVKGGAKAIDFYERALGAKLTRSMEMPNGALMYAELVFGESKIMLSDELPDWDVLSPQTLGGTPVGLFLYVADVDAAYKQAIDAGGTEVQPLTNQFWGDRTGTFLDPFGHKWTLATRVEEVSDEETKRRGDELMKKMGGSE